MLGLQSSVFGASGFLRVWLAGFCLMTSTLSFTLVLLVETFHVGPFGGEMLMLLIICL